MSVCLYAACTAHAPCCHVLPARLYSMFPGYLINGTIFKKKLLNTEVFFPQQFLSETFFFVRIGRDMLTWILVLM